MTDFLVKRDDLRECRVADGEVPEIESGQVLQDMFDPLRVAILEARPSRVRNQKIASTAQNE